MPEGQLTNLILDPNTGGIITPGVFVNDDFTTNKLANYINFRTGDKKNATVANGQLYNNTLGSVQLTNNRPFLYGRSLISMTPGSFTNFNIALFAKILDDINYLVIQTWSTGGSLQVFQTINGVNTRLDAADIVAPVNGDGSEWWYVCRVGRFKGQTKFTVETYLSPPYMLYPPYQVREYSPDLKFGSISGYSGIYMDPFSTTTPSSATIGDWIVTDDTVRTVF
jgi:hypothetical protein